MRQPGIAAYAYFVSVRHNEIILTAIFVIFIISVKCLHL